jgi:hypothetical protein
MGDDHGNTMFRMLLVIKGICGDIAVYHWCVKECKPILNSLNLVFNLKLNFCRVHQGLRLWYRLQVRGFKDLLYTKHLIDPS